MIKFGEKEMENKLEEMTKGKLKYLTEIPIGIYDKGNLSSGSTSNLGAILSSYEEKRMYLEVSKKTTDNQGSFRIIKAYIEK